MYRMNFKQREFCLFLHMSFAKCGRFSRKCCFTEDMIYIEGWTSTPSFVFCTKLLYDDMDGLVLTVKAEMHHLV